MKHFLTVVATGSLDIATISSVSPRVVTVAAKVATVAAVVATLSSNIIQILSVVAKD